MDFWPQHKDFILKVLAGFGVFLVALIAKGIVYGDELDQELASNRSLASQIRRVKLYPDRDVRKLEDHAEALKAQMKASIDRLGWDATKPDLQRAIIKRILGHMRDYRGAPAATLDAAADRILANMAADLPSAFGQLQASVRDSLTEEAEESNFRIPGGLGFDALERIEDEAQTRIKYLVQLELAARVVRFAVDAGVDSVDEVIIQTDDKDAIRGANPDFLREYVLEAKLFGAQKAIFTVLNDLEGDGATVPLRGYRFVRVGGKKKPNHLNATLRLAAVVTDGGKEFAAPEEDG